MATSNSEREYLARIAARGLSYDTTPDWDEYSTASWAVQDTIERVAGL